MIVFRTPSLRDWFGKQSSAFTAPMSEQLTVLFWNVNRRDRRSLVNRLAADKGADIVALVEHDATSDATLNGLRSEVDKSFFQPQAETPRLQIFARRPDLNLREVYGSANGRVTIRILRFQHAEMLFAVAHLPSKMNFDSRDQAAEAAVLADEIRTVEVESGHQRTILVGDLNMNPFEEGIVSAIGLHAMMTKPIAMTKSRIVQGREYPFFYNPMWGFFGDRTDGPPGTFYYRSSGYISYEWNIFDQVLLRPDVLPWFQDDIEIVVKIGETELGRTGGDGRPNSEVSSDHFPIVLQLASRT